MPVRTIYVKKDDLRLWEKAQAQLGQSISAFVVDCLKQRLATAPKPGEMGKISLTFWDSNSKPTITKSFKGRWLVGKPGEGMRTADNTHDWVADAQWHVFQTAKGKIVVYVTHSKDGFAPLMGVYESFGQLKDDATVPPDVIAKAANALEIPYEIELDI